jgi:hypothetical protein
VGHGDVGDRGVQGLHEGCQGDGYGNDPWVGAGTPCFVERECGCCCQCWAFLWVLKSLSRWSPGETGFGVGAYSE